jgi:hypothetical protein
LSQTKFRIPRVTTAALLLGSAACGSDGGGTPGGTTKGVNVSSSRMTAIAKQMCKQYQQCDEEYFDEYYDDLGDCTDVKSEEFEGQAEGVNKACADAALDYLACYSTLSCKDLPGEGEAAEKCEDFVDAYEEECEGAGLDDGSSIDGSEAKRAARARAVIRKYRIPR